MDIEQFTAENAPDDGGKTFQLEHSKLLDIDLDGTTMAKAGSMIGYTGDISFERTSTGGLKGMLKRSVTSEDSVLMAAEGSGHLYLADQGKEIQLLELSDDDAISVNGNDILAFEDTIDWDIKMMKSFGGTSAGGLFNVHLDGPGHVAITTHGEPLVVVPPVNTDPDATVAWSATISPDVTTDMNIKTFLGQSSGETYQLEFSDEEGFVVLQPFEETLPNE